MSTPKIMETRIFEKIKAALAPSHLELVNESSQHSVPPGSETHFKLIVVSSSFEGISKLAQQRKVYQILAQELNEGVHALALRTFSESQWKAQGESVDAPSPNCQGGGKAKLD